MFNIYLCMTQQHDWRLVSAAVGVCALGLSAALWLFLQTPRDPGARPILWLGMTGLVAGAAIWTTHFVAMLAFRSGLPTGFGLIATLASLAIAVSGCWAGLFLSSIRIARCPDWAPAAAGGVILGFSITVMHYVGMAGYRTAGVLRWNPLYVMASFGIGALLGGTAMFMARPSPAKWRHAASTLILMVGVTGMHFTGMAGVSILPDPTIAVPPSSMSVHEMALAAIAATAFIVLAALGGVIFNIANREGVLKRLRIAIDAMPEGLAFYDAQDRLVVWNKQYDDLCKGCGPLTAGRTYADILGARVRSGDYPLAVGFEDVWLERRLAAHQGAEGSAHHPIADGRWLQIRERRTADKGIVTVCVDVTEMKRAEETMATARDKALAASRMKSEFLANMSHEIRTPMNGIMVMNDLLLRTNLDPKQEKFAQIMRKSAESLLAIINDVLDMAKLEAGEFDLQDSAFSLDAVIDEALSVARASALDKGLGLTAELDAAAGRRFRGDAARIRQILNNLMSNAVKFTDTGYVVVRVFGVSAGPLSTRIRIEVQDTGIGLTDAAKSMLFGAFQQADGSTTRRFGGAGLGLAISRRLIDLMGGRIGVSDRPGGGSIFWFELDLAAAADSADADHSPGPRIRRLG